MIILFKLQLGTKLPSLVWVAKSVILLYYFLLQSICVWFADSFCTIKVTDESHTKDGISVNIFAESMEKLPYIASVGDIILLSHVVV